MTDEDRARRRAAKRFNERVKLFATFLNNVGVAILVGAVVLPTVNLPGKAMDATSVWLAVAFSLHLVAQIVLTAFRSED